MNLDTLHPEEKNISFVQLFKGEGLVTAMRLQANEILQKHTTRTPALLVCVSGQVVYHEERGTKVTLGSGDYVHIEADVVHWVESLSRSNLLLLK